MNILQDRTGKCYAASEGKDNGSKNAKYCNIFILHIFLGIM